MLSWSLRLVAEHVVSCPASDRLMRAVRQIDCAGAGPLTCQSVKWCYALRVGRICNANCKRERKRGYARKLFQPARWRRSNRRPLKIDATTTKHTRLPLWNVKALPRLTMKPCTKIGPDTMYAKICAVIVLIQVFGAAAFAADEKNLPGPQPLNPFQGTPEEAGGLRARCEPICAKTRSPTPSAFLPACRRTGSASGRSA